jgi:hypothetical protein
MHRHSYVLTGTDKGMAETFGRSALQTPLLLRCISTQKLHRRMILFAFCLCCGSFVLRCISTCHGAGRALSRNKSRNALEYVEAMDTAAHLIIFYTKPFCIMHLTVLACLG